MSNHTILPLLAQPVSSKPSQLFNQSVQPLRRMEIMFHFPADWSDSEAFRFVQDRMVMKQSEDAPMEQCVQTLKNGRVCGLGRMAYYHCKTSDDGNSHPFKPDRTIQALHTVSESALHDASIEHLDGHDGTRSAWSFRKGALWMARQTGAVVTPNE